jgi:hypothetical protein
MVTAQMELQAFYRTQDACETQLDFDAEAAEAQAAKAKEAAKKLDAYR